MILINALALLCISFASSSALLTHQHTSLEKRSPIGGNNNLVGKPSSVNAILRSPIANTQQLSADEIRLKKEIIERIPKHVLVDKLLSYLNISDSINLRGIKEFDLRLNQRQSKGLEVNEELLIQYYSVKEPVQIVKYIFWNHNDSDETRIAHLNLFFSNPKVQDTLNRERRNNRASQRILLIALHKGLGELVANGQLGFLQLVLENHILKFGSIQLRSEDIAIAAERGYKEMVEWLLKQSQYSLVKNLSHQYENRYSALMGCIEGEQFEIFKSVVDMISNGDDITFAQRMRLLLELANANLKQYLDYILTRIDQAQKKNVMTTLVKRYVMRSSLRGGNQVKKPPLEMLEMLDYILKRPEWNTCEISFLLKAMSTANYELLERLGREFLNTNVQFYQSRVFRGKKKIFGEFSGIDALDAAIQLVDQFSTRSYWRVKQVLWKIKYVSSKRSILDINTVDKHSSVKEPEGKKVKHAKSYDWDSFVLWDF